MHHIIRQLDEKRAAARLGGGQKRIDAQHAKGKLTARERIELLLDTELVRRMGHVQGSPLHRLRHGQPDRCPATAWSPATAPSTAGMVFVFSQDFTVFGGSLSEAHAEKICKIMDQA